MHTMVILSKKHLWYQKQNQGPKPFGRVITRGHM
jgi:hypothetical protein